MELELEDKSNECFLNVRANEGKKVICRNLKNKNQ